MPVTTRPVTPADRSGWDPLYAGYAELYRVDQTTVMRDRVWSWLMDPAHPVTGFVAEAENGLIGLAHCRPFARPLSATTGGYLDDLFVAPASRGTGAAEALVAAVRTHGVAQGWSVIRWITAEDNARARALYARIATQTRWVTYDIPL